MIAILFLRYLLIALFVLNLFPIFSPYCGANERKEEASELLKPERYRNLFSESIFDSYLIQLKGFINNHPLYPELIQALNNHPKNSFLNKIESFMQLIDTQPFTLEEKRSYHQEFLRILRELLKERESYDPGENQAIVLSIQWIDELTYWMYTTPQLLPQYREFLQTRDLLPGREEIAGREFAEIIADSFAKIRNNPKFKGSIHPHKGILDSHLDGYVPFFLFRAFSVPFILLPRPLIDYKEENRSEVAPEFLRYLSDLTSKGQKHLYINVMKRASSGETKYWSFMETLELNPEWKESFWLVTLDKRSDFYWQENQYSNCSIAEDFKKHFMNKFFEKSIDESLFKWPQQLEIAPWKLYCQVLLNSIHKTLFDDKKSLTRQERLDFIEIAYIRIIQSLCEIIRPDFANISCRDSIDRGPSLLSLLYIYERLQTQKLLTIDDKMTALTILLAPPLLAHNRPSHESKIDRVIAAITHLIRFTPKS